MSIKRTAHILKRASGAGREAVWIDDSILKASYDRFESALPGFRCINFAPGPLEARKRSARRRLAHVSQESGRGAEHMDPCLLAATNAEARHRNWRWQSPSSAHTLDSQVPITLPPWLSDMINSSRESLPKKDPEDEVKLRSQSPFNEQAFFNELGSCKSVDEIRELAVSLDFDTRDHSQKILWRLFKSTRSLGICLEYLDDTTVRQQANGTLPYFLHLILPHILEAEPQELAHLRRVLRTWVKIQFTLGLRSEKDIIDLANFVRRLQGSDRLTDMQNELKTALLQGLGSSSVFRYQDLTMQTVEAILSLISHGTPPNNIQDLGLDLIRHHLSPSSPDYPVTSVSQFLMSCFQCSATCRPAFRRGVCHVLQAYSDDIRLRVLRYMTLQLLQWQSDPSSDLSRKPRQMYDWWLRLSEHVMPQCPDRDRNNHPLEKRMPVALERESIRPPDISSAQLSHLVANYLQGSATPEPGSQRRIIALLRECPSDARLQIIRSTSLQLLQSQSESPSDVSGNISGIRKWWLLVSKHVMPQFADRGCESLLVEKRMPVDKPDILVSYAQLLCEKKMAQFTVWNWFACRLSKRDLMKLWKDVRDDRGHDRHRSFVRMTMLVHKHGLLDEAFVWHVIQVLRRMHMYVAIADIYTTSRRSGLQMSPDIASYIIPQMLPSSPHFALRVFNSDRGLLLENFPGLARYIIESPRKTPYEVWALARPRSDKKSIAALYNNPEHTRAARIDLLETIAWTYARAPRFTSNMAFRYVHRCYLYYKFGGLGPVTSKISRALTWTVIIRPMLERGSVGISRLNWVLGVIHQVEGADRADKVYRFTSQWRKKLEEGLSPPSMQYLQGDLFEEEECAEDPSSSFDIREDRRWLKRKIRFVLLDERAHSSNPTRRRYRDGMISRSKIRRSVCSRPRTRKLVSV